MAQGTKFKTFKAFWPEYLRLHSRPTTRAIHYAGTLLGIGLATTGVIAGASALIIAAPLVTYGLLFPAHPIFEKNKPATFKNPLMSIGGDFKMLFFWMTGRLENEYKKHGLDYTGKTGNNQNDPTIIRKPSEGPSFLTTLKSKLSGSFNKSKTATPVKSTDIVPPNESQKQDIKPQV